MQVVCIFIMTAWKECPQGVYIPGEYFSMNYQKKVFENNVRFVEGSTL